MVDRAAVAAPVTQGQPGPHIVSSSGETHGQRKRPQRQEEAEVQELRRQGAGEEGGQGGEMPEVWRDGGAVIAVALAALRYARLKWDLARTC
jgi:hypothetical protein